MSRLSLFGAIHFDRRAKVEDELREFVATEDADAIFIEWPGENVTRRTVALAVLRAPAMLLGTFFVGLIQGVGFALFNRRLDSTEHVVAKRLSERYPVHEIDRNLLSLMTDSGLVGSVVNWAVLIGFLVLTPVQTVITIIAILVGGGVTNVAALRSRRLAALTAVCAALGLLALAVVTDLLAGWFLLALALAFIVLMKRTLDTRNGHMTERIETITSEKGYDSSVLVTGAAHLPGMVKRASDAGFALGRTYTPRWLRAPGKIEENPVESAESADRANDTVPVELGSAGARAAASVVDFVALAVLVWIPALVLGAMSQLLLDGFLSGVLAGVIATPFAYYVLLEARYGTTLGKHLEGLVVTGRDGSPASLRACLLRNLLRPVDFVAFYLLGFVVVLATDRDQRLGDLVAGTEIRVGN